VRLAPCPCHVVPSNMSIEPGRPQASHETASADGRGPSCEPAMNRVAPFSNAVKYSPANTLISVRAAQQFGDVVVTLEDHGIGIPVDDLSRLFERYYRGSNVSGVVGTGVGLYLVKIVVDLHGGSIAVESTEGSGSRFTLRLPVTPNGRTDQVKLSSAP